MISKYHPAYLTDGLWGKRPGIMFLSRTDGFVVAYDICYKLNETIFSSKVTDFPITSMVLSKEGDKLFVADEEGKVSMLKLSKSFYEQTQLQKTTNQGFLNTMFEREVNKEKSIEILIERKKKKGAVKDDTAKLAKQEQQMKERLKQIEMDYMSFVSSNITIDPKREESHKVEADNKDTYSKRATEQDRSIRNDSSIISQKKDLNQSDAKEEVVLNQSQNKEILNISADKGLNQSGINSENLNVSKKDNLNNSQLGDNKSFKEEQKDPIVEENKQDDHISEKAENKSQVIEDVAADQ
jgi:hypothetical protein